LAKSFRELVFSFPEAFFFSKRKARPLGYPCIKIKEEVVFNAFGFDDSSKAKLYSKLPKSFGLQWQLAISTSQLACVCNHKPAGLCCVRSLKGFCQSHNAVALCSSSKQAD